MNTIGRSPAPVSRPVLDIGTGASSPALTARQSVPGSCRCAGKVRDGVIAMARARKGARSITVDAVDYRWRASSHDDLIAIAIWPDGPFGRTITARLHDGGCRGENPSGRNHRSPRTLVVTNRLIKRLNDLAASVHEYVPTSRGSPTSLGDVAGQIDLTDAIVADDKRW